MLGITLIGTLLVSGALWEDAQGTRAPSEVVGRPDLEPNDDGSYDVFEDSGIHVRAAPIRHLIPCVGYVVSEKQSRIRLKADVLDPVIAKNAHQLADAREWPELRGEPKAVYKLLSKMERGDVFRFPDGTRVSPSEIFAEAPEPRKFCIAFDTCDASLLTPFARGADILVSWRDKNGNSMCRGAYKVHEATMSGAKGTSSNSDPSPDPMLPMTKLYPSTEGFLRDGAEDSKFSAKDLMGSQVQTASAAAFERGHASAAMAGRLLLTHFSQRYRGDAALRSVLTMERVEEEARRAYEIERQLQDLPRAPSPLQVMAAWDGLTVVMPQRSPPSADKSIDTTDSRKSTT